MEEQNSPSPRTDFSKIVLLLTIVAFCVVAAGLFCCYQPPTHPRIEVATKSDGTQELFFTPAKLPSKLTFAGEEVPLENFDTRESLDREMLITANYHSQTLLYIKKANRYFSTIEPILRQNDIPEDFKYLSLAESGFFEKIISPTGAIGLWQFMKTAAIENGLEVNEEVDERYNIEKSTEAACRYLKRSFAKYGNWTMVAASYNAGMAGINKQIEVQDCKNYYDLLLNEETSRYLFRILALKLIVNSPEAYGFKVADDEKYPVIKVDEIKVSSPIPNLIKFAREHEINYKLLKQFNPWLRQSSLKNLKGKTYVIKIPQLGNYRKFSYSEPDGK